MTSMNDSTLDAPSALEHLNSCRCMLCTGDRKSHDHCRDMSKPHLQKDLDDRIQATQQQVQMNKPKISSQNESISDNDDDAYRNESKANCKFDLGVRLGLLLLQFAMAFASPKIVETNNMRWSVVNSSIMVFEGTSILFRSSCKTQRVKSSLLWLLPEIVMDCVLGLLARGKLHLSYQVLVLGTLMLALFIVVMCVYELSAPTTTNTGSTSSSSSSITKTDTSTFHKATTTTAPTATATSRLDMAESSSPQ
jgi:hypothetical protein